MTSVIMHITSSPIGQRTTRSASRISDLWHHAVITGLLLLGALAPSGVLADKIAIIIDDIGYSLTEGKAAIQLAPEIAISLLPAAPYAAQLSDLAIEHGNETMLHLPMQAMTHRKPAEPHQLTLAMTEEEFKRQIRLDLDAFPLVTGVNNHMGSLLTQHPGHMAWLMEVLDEHPGMFFIDSRTYYKTVAAKTAGEYAIPHASRDVFLDPGQGGAQVVHEQLKTLLKIAADKGFALAIGHPHPATIQALRQFIARLPGSDHELVPVSQYVQEQESQPCPECSSPLLKVVKNSKQSP